MIEMNICLPAAIQLKRCCPGCFEEYHLTLYLLAQLASLKIINKHTQWNKKH